MSASDTHANAIVNSVVIVVISSLIYFCSFKQPRSFPFVDCL
jgi:hypothetical protein